MNSNKSVAAYPAVRLSTLMPLALAAFSNFAAAQDGRGPDLEGMWIDSFSAYADPRWDPEDLACIVCSDKAIEYLRTVMEQEELPSLEELSRAMMEFDKQWVYELLTEQGRERYLATESSPDPGCEPIGLVQHVRGLLSFKFEQFEDRVTLQYEYLGPTPTVYMDGRDHPPDLQPSLLGHSIGWYDGPTLVVETTGLEPNTVRSAGDPLTISESALVFERFTRHEGDDWFDYEVTVVDPRTYREPLKILKQRRLLERGHEFEIYDCQVVSGEF